jgi:hypothetical protein
MSAPIVNSAKYDGPECTRPVSDNEIPSDGQLPLLWRCSTLMVPPSLHAVIEELPLGAKVSKGF